MEDEENVDRYTRCICCGKRAVVVIDFRDLTGKLLEAFGACRVCHHESCWMREDASAVCDAPVRSAPMRPLRPIEEETNECFILTGLLPTDMEDACRQLRRELTYLALKKYGSVARAAAALNISRYSAYRWVDGNMKDVLRQLRAEVAAEVAVVAPDAPGLRRSVHT